MSAKGAASILVALTHAEREQIKADAKEAGFSSVREYAEVQLLGHPSARRETFGPPGRRPKTNVGQGTFDLQTA